MGNDVEENYPHIVFVLYILSPLQRRCQQTKKG